MIKPDNHILVIFGASGDLTSRKLVPAVFDLFAQQLLPQGFALLGVGRSKLGNNEFRDKMKSGILAHSNMAKTHAHLIEAFLCFLNYVAIDTALASDYALLKEQLGKLNKLVGANGNYLYYLATPPEMYEKVADNLKMCGLHNSDEIAGWKRIIIEKPFGRSLLSARALNKKLLEIFTEEQLYRIDHYLGKETVQNLLVFRFSNGFFEPLWNRNFIHMVEITAAEEIGIENRGGYYDSAGAMRDMVQNHLLQLAGLTALEPPSMFEANSLRNEMVKVFQALRPMGKAQIHSDVVRGQYIGSPLNEGNLKSYCNEPGVANGSKTETFIAMRFFIDNWRWGGVPFYIRTGKRLQSRVTEIVIHLKSTPHSLFQGQCSGPSCNKLIIRIQPNEAISMQIGLKMPGAGYQVRQVRMDFKYANLSNVYIPSAYERLLLDCMSGDSTLYIRGDAVDATWSFIDPILHEMENNPDMPLYYYNSNSWGPKEAADLMGNMWDEPFVAKTSS